MASAAGRASGGGAPRAGNKCPPEESESGAQSGRVGVAITKKKSGRIGNGLVALSSAAVLTVYTAGYLRTKAAAQQFAGEAVDRRSAAPIALHPVGSGPSQPGLTPAPEASALPSASPALSELRLAQASASRAAEQGRGTEARSSASDGHAASTAAPDSADAAPAPALSDAPPRQPLIAALAASSAPTSDPIAGASAARAADVQLAPPPKPQGQYKDGTYTGWGTSRHGDIQAAVVIEGGRIASATIAQCLTRYSCSWISPLPPQVVTRQSAEVDYVSGATQSTNAFYYAVLEALAKAK